MAYSGQQFSADLDSIPLSITEDDPIAGMRLEINSWIHSICGQDKYEDPVFEGMVRDFAIMNQSLHTMFKGIEKFMKGIDTMCQAMIELSEALVTGLAKSSERTIISDCCKFREATCGISIPDAPHSIVAKLKRDLEFNVSAPLKAHFSHNKKLRTQLYNRRRRLQEYIYAKKQYLILKNHQEFGATHFKCVQAEITMRHALETFQRIDKPIFEWLLMLEEYKKDIYDSLLQTLKYLQYEFFAGSAHCFSSILPKRMEFRPLIEMTPDHLAPQVQVELNESLVMTPDLEDSSDPIILTCPDATTKILDRWQREDHCLSAPILTTQSLTPVDQLSLSVLLAQGFSEESSRQALRYHDNHTQTALECLLEGHTHSNSSSDEQHQRELEQVLESVRIPSTLKWVKKLKNYRQTKQLLETSHCLNDTPPMLNSLKNLTTDISQENYLSDSVAGCVFNGESTIPVDTASMIPLNISIPNNGSERTCLDMFQSVTAPTTPIKPCVDLLGDIDQLKQTNSLEIQEERVELISMKDVHSKELSLNNNNSFNLSNEESGNSETIPHGTQIPVCLLMTEPHNHLCTNRPLMLEDLMDKEFQTTHTSMFVFDKDTQCDLCQSDEY